MGLEPLPQTYAATRAALHTVAERLVAPARKPDNEIALTATPGGFGTPAFDFDGARIQVRVEGAELVVERDGEVERGSLQTLDAGAALIGDELLGEAKPAGDTPLAIDPEAAARLGDFYAFAARVLERLRTALAPGDDPSPINLWPEHFDLAFEAGSEAAGLRANYGASPGDEQHREPYLYVGPWTARPEGRLWNATTFSGAEMAYEELVGAGDAEALADEFLARRRAELGA